LIFSSLREARVVRFVADNITMYGMPREKCRTFPEVFSMADSRSESMEGRREPEVELGMAPGGFGESKSF